MDPAKGTGYQVLGKSCIDKIIRMVGKSLKADRATTNKERLAFTRVLVEISLNHKYPTSILFENEWGKIREQDVEYEWKPMLCPKCKNFGHELHECRK